VTSTSIVRGGSYGVKSSWPSRNRLGSARANVAGRPQKEHSENSSDKWWDWWKMYIDAAGDGVGRITNACGAGEHPNEVGIPRWTRAIAVFFSLVWHVLPSPVAQEPFIQPR